MVEIILKTNNEVLLLAARELSKYIELMAGKRSVTKISYAYGEGVELGLYEDFGIPCDVEDSRFDDAVYVDVKASKGIIAGPNPRSVLFGVYRLLEANGCRWLRHGKDGSFVPHRCVDDLFADIKEKAAFRYRGFCIEGAVSYENMLDNIEWAAKLGFNSYFLEFMVPYAFFDRYYSHMHNPYKTPEPRSVEEVKAYCAQLELEIKKRGMLFHSVGHGWTSEVIGLDALGWYAEDVRLDSENQKLLAQVDGKRELYKGISLNTNLCYGSPEVRNKLVLKISDYAESHPYVDMLHFWLADNYNNICECELCRDTIPADFFVMMMNDIDLELKRRNLDTKIVFLNYQELLWPPEKAKIKNPDRFAMLFAPISRTYSVTYDDNTDGVSLPPYNRNKVVLPKGIKENVAFLKAWQKQFKGDCFVYEYHFMWDCYFDPGFYEIAKGLSRAIKNLKRMGLDGVIEDQSQRNFFPNGYPMYLYGKTMWDYNADADALAKEYFSAAYGVDGELCRCFMEKLSELFDPVYIRGDKDKLSDAADFIGAMFSGNGSAVDMEAANRLAKIPELVYKFRSVVERNLTLDDAALAQSWKYILLYTEMLPALSEAFRARAEGNAELAEVYWHEVKDFVQKHEDDFQSVFDICEFITVLHNRFEGKDKK